MTGSSVLLIGCKQEKTASDTTQGSHSQTSSPDTSALRLAREIAPRDTANLPYLDDTDHGQERDSISLASSKWPKPSTFTSQQSARLAEALRIANNIIADTLIINIIRDLQNLGQIDWNAPSTTRRYSQLPPDEQKRPTVYIMEQFAHRGLNAITNFKPYTWPKGSTVTGEASCKNNPKVNVALVMERSIGSIAGTIIHERIHTFCQRHTCNCPEDNQCDMAYQAGSLARVINLYRANNSRPIKLPYKMCSDLKTRLKAHHII